MTESDDDGWEDYESGPFCRHWGDPADCDVDCARCGHHCHKHEFEKPGECRVEGCDCEGWLEEATPNTPSGST